MKNIVTFLLVLFPLTAAKSQLYFPPPNSTDWDTLSPSTLGWCQEKIDSLCHFLDTNNTRAFILLKDGKIVLEKYFNGHSAGSNWYWASAGKTLTAFMTGIAQQEGFLSITDTTSTYLGQGWTNAAQEQEEKITIRHQLTMTSGLDDDVADLFCTIDTCLIYKTDAGNRWAYHNGPYTLLDSVVEKATGVSLNLYTTQKLKVPTGMDGLFIKQGYNNVFFSTARSMARFGLLILNRGNWDGTEILSDAAYFDDMVNTSQSLNESYGYLWWLNGKNSYMIPQAQFVFSGSMNPNAPEDMIAALGKNGQFINVAPSGNMVWIRMGDAPDNSLVPFTFNDDIWKHLNDLACDPVTNSMLPGSEAKVQVFPNPGQDLVFIELDDNTMQAGHYSLRDHIGQLVKKGSFTGNRYGMEMTGFPAGIYYLTIHSNGFDKTFKVIKE